MVVVSGNTLGERQRDLNSKVADVIAAKKEFNKIKTENETSDLDKLYKIDIANQYRDIDYIVEVLKSGDTLYISRTLRCMWLYHDDYFHVINAENLHLNIFPYMSINMKKKMLVTMSTHIRNEQRASMFFLYCKKNKMPNIAFKFLNFTSEDFKLNVLKNEWNNTFSSYLDSEIKLHNFIGDSFVLATAWIKSSEWRHVHAIQNLKFLYSVDNDKFLDMMEEYISIDENNMFRLKRLGIRISRDIMIKHKQKVLDKPLLYINSLNKSMITKYSTSDNAKKYMARLLPDTVEQFWSIQYFNIYDFIINLMPGNEKFQFLKQLFNLKYPNESFELDNRFYQLEYYKIMTNEEKELWALRHLQDKQEYLGKGNDYILYQFVNFQKAFIELKKCIMNSPDKNKRAAIINVLLDAVQNQKDLATVLNYFYDRHINESEDFKNQFINKVMDDHKVFEFNDECWEALNKLFSSLDIYMVNRPFGNFTYKAVAVACHILRNQPLPQALLNFIDLDVNYHYFGYLYEKMSKEKSEIVLQYMIKLIVEKLQPFEQDPNNKNLRQKLKKYVNNIFTLLGTFHKDDEECPEIVKKFREIDMPSQKEPKKITEKDILRFLKKDIKMATDVLLHFENHIIDWPERLNNVLRKLKVYFPYDLRPQYLSFLDRWLSNLSDDYGSNRVIKAAIFGILQIADRDFKVALMDKYQPLGSKIDHSENFDRKLLTIQEAICRFVGYSRPPVPMEMVLKYIKGDYVHFCLPMFNMYLVNLPLPQAIEFTEAIINAPVSVQKHGLRLAFLCYSSENLKNLVLNAWKKTKNVSLRLILYTSLFDKVIDEYEEDEMRTDLYEVLKLMTLDLREDEDYLFNLISSNRMSLKFRGDYLRTGWDLVTKLPDKPSNIKKQTEIIKCIERNIKIVKRDYVRTCIINEHVLEMLDNRRLRPPSASELEELYKVKWGITAGYIVQYSSSIELEDSLGLLKLIFTTCLNSWNEVHDDCLVFQQFFYNFLNTMKNKSLIYSVSAWRIFDHILVVLKESLPMKEIYLTVWDLQLYIYARISVDDGDSVMTDSGDSITQVSSDDMILIITKFANHIIQFVQELLLKQQFYTTFYPVITKLLKTELRDIRVQCNLNKENLDLELIFCDLLTNASMKETNLLSLMILPLSVSEEQKDTRTEILRKIQAFGDEEVQTLLCSTLKRGDFKKMF